VLALVFWLVALIERIIKPPADNNAKPRIIAPPNDTTERH